MQRQEALTQAAREVLYTLVKESPYTSKHIAERVGELPSTLTHRLKGNRPGYLNLDTSLVVSILTVIDVPFGEYATQVEARAAQILQESRTQR